MIWTVTVKVISFKTQIKTALIHILLLKTLINYFFNISFGCYCKVYLHYSNLHFKIQTNNLFFLKSHLPE